MPFALPLLADLLWAVLAILVAIAGAVIGKLVARLFPDINAWFVHVNIGQWVDQHIDDALDWIAGYTKAYWVRVSNWFHGHAYLLGGLFGAVVAALTHHGDQIAHHNNVTIPDAQSNAIATAKDHADQLHSVAESDITTAKSDAISHADTLAKSLQSNIDKLANVTLPDAISAAEAHDHAELATAESALAAEIQGIQGSVDQLNRLATVTIPAEIAAGVAAAEGESHAQLATAVGNLQAELDGLQAEIDSANQTIAANAAAIATAEAELSKLSTSEASDASAITAANAAISVANGKIAAAQSQIDTANGNIDQLTSQLDTLQGVATITQANIAPLEQVTSLVIPATLAGVVAAVTSVATEVENCAVTTCDGPNNIKGVLEGLLGALTATAEVGFIGEAVRDPTGTADALAPLLDSIDTGANDLLSLVLAL